MLAAGLVLIVLGLILFLISVIGASQDSRQGVLPGAFKPLKWLVGQLRKPIDNLTQARLKWYRRVVALGEICLLVGLFLVVLNVFMGGDSSDPPSTTTTTTAA